MRDSLTLHAGSYDEDDLCDDMGGGLYEDINDLQAKGLLIWGEPVV